MPHFHESDDEEFFTKKLLDDSDVTYIKHYQSNSLSDEILRLFRAARFRSIDLFYISSSEEFNTDIISSLFWNYYNLYFPENKKAKIKLCIPNKEVWYELTLKKECNIIDALYLYNDEYDIFSTLEDGTVFFCLDEFESPRHIAELAFYFLYIPEDEKYDRAEAEADLIALSKVIMQPENIEKLKQELASLDKKLDPLRVRERLNKYIPDKTELEIKQSLTNCELHQLDKLLFFYP